MQTLPDQQHVFYMNDINGCSLEQSAVMVSKIPFTHPTNVAQVLNSLRQQLLFNTVIGSSIRPTASHGKKIFDFIKGYDFVNCNFCIYKHEVM